MRARLPGWSGLGAAAVFAGVLGLARMTAQTFPYPWNDEARFFLPSWVYARTGSLRPVLLHAPDGIFWTPHAFYVLFGLVLRVFGESMAVARTANQLLVAAAAALLIVAHARVAGSAWFGALSGLLLISPPVVLAANEVRMESVVAWLFAVALLLVTAGWRLAALAALVLSLLFHPAMMFALVLYVAVLVFERMRPGLGGRAGMSTGGTPARLAEWVLLGMVVVAFAAEGVFILRHWHLFREHMSYQSGRKLHHGIVAAIAKPQGLVLLLECLVAGLVGSWWRRGEMADEVARELLPVTAIALGLQLYAVLGAEFQYDVYSMAIAPATFFCVGYRLVAARWQPGLAGIPASQAC